MFIQNFDVEADALFCGESIHVAADGIHLPRNLLGGAMPSPFEDHVLDKMRNAVPFRVFVARSRLEPNADRRRANMRHLFCDDRQPVWQNVTANAAGFLGHVYFLLKPFLDYKKGG